jgi:hypothetical protein
VCGPARGGTLAPVPALWQWVGPLRAAFPFPPISRAAGRCRSSVVEHPLGKGEVVSSILTGSTNKLGTSQIAFLQNCAEQNAKRPAETHQIRTRRSPSGLRKLFDELRESAWRNDVARQSVLEHVGHTIGRPAAVQAGTAAMRVAPGFSDTGPAASGPGAPNKSERGRSLSHACHVSRCGAKTTGPGRSRNYAGRQRLSVRCGRLGCFEAKRFFSRFPALWPSLGDLLDWSSIGRYSLVGRSNSGCDLKHGSRGCDA